jgi:2-polyprenyl-3-methyl-5-hydroxy-6-metoxy-1,4-benzoquinol methylase
MTKAKSAIKCPLCGAASGFRLERRTSPFGRCGCGMVLNTGRAIAETYEGDYFSTEDQAAGHRDFRSDWSREYDRRRFSFELETMVGCPTDRGRLLDIGSATGSYLMLAQEMGWSVLGVEVSEEARRIAENVGLQSVSSLEAVPHDELFPMITMHHVLEHLEAPGAMLAQCRDRLAPGGRLLVEVPNYRSLERIGLGSRWIDLRPEQHRWQFEPTTLYRLLEQSAFTVTSVRTLGEPIQTLRTVARTIGLPVRESAAHERADSVSQGANSVAANASAKQAAAAKVGAVADRIVNRALLGKRLLMLAKAA